MSFAKLEPAGCFLDREPFMEGKVHVRNVRVHLYDENKYRLITVDAELKEYEHGATLEGNFLWPTTNRQQKIGGFAFTQFGQWLSRYDLYAKRGTYTVIEPGDGYTAQLCLSGWEAYE